MIVLICDKNNVVTTLKTNFLLVMLKASMFRSGLFKKKQKLLSLLLPST